MYRRVYRLVPMSLFPDKKKKKNALLLTKRVALIE